MRRIPVILAVFAVFAIASPALAIPGCGTGFDLLSVAGTLERVDARIYTAEEFAQVEDIVAAQDLNGDGSLCSKQYKPNQGQDKKWIGPEDGAISDYVLTLVKDNTANGQGS